MGGTSMAPRKMLKMSQRKKSEPMRRSSALSDVHLRSTCAALAAAQAHTNWKYCKTIEVIVYNETERLYISILQTRHGDARSCQ